MVWALRRLTTDSTQLAVQHKGHHGRSHNNVTTAIIEMYMLPIIKVYSIMHRKYLVKAVTGKTDMEV